jgi:hypothetical protein
MIQLTNLVELIRESLAYLHQLFYFYQQIFFLRVQMKVTHSLLHRGFKKTHFTFNRMP